MEDVTIGAKLTLDTNDGIKSMKQFRKEVKEAEGDLAAMTQKFGATSKEAAAAAKKVAELKDAMGDAKSLVDAFNPDTKFRAFGASINTVVGGFSALQGVLGLVGVESEEVQKSLLKVQSALAISQGFSQLQEGLQTFKNLGAVIQSTTLFQKANAVATNLAAGAMRLFGIQTTATSTAMSVLKGAIIATGIGALVVLLGVAADAMGLFSSSTDDAAEKQKKLADSIENTNESLSVAEQSLRRSQQLEIAQAEKRGATPKEIFDIQQKYRKLDFEATTEAYDKVKNLDEAEAAKKVARLKDINVEGQTAQINFEIAEQKRREEALKKAAEKEKELQKKLREQALKDQQDETEVRAIKTVTNIQRPTLPGATVEELTIQRVAETNKHFRDQMAEDDAVYTNDYNEQIESRKANDEAEYQNRKTLLEGSGNLLNAFSELIGKQTAAGKVLAIAQATINTYLGVTEVLRAKTTLPEPLGTIAKIINVGTIIATGISAIKNIVKAQVPGGGGGSVPAVSAPLSPQSPGATSTSLDQRSLNAIGSATTRAFVLDSDIANNRERITRINRAARI